MKLDEFKLGILQGQSANIISSVRGESALTAFRNQDPEMAKLLNEVTIALVMFQYDNTKILMEHPLLKPLLKK